MNTTYGGAQAPKGQSRPITAYSISAIVHRSSEAMVDPEFDEDTFTRSPAGDTLYAVRRGLGQ